VGNAYKASPFHGGAPLAAGPLRRPAQDFRGLIVWKHGPFSAQRSSVVRVKTMRDEFFAPAERRIALPPPVHERRHGVKRDTGFAAERRKMMMEIGQAELVPETIGRLSPARISSIRPQRRAASTSRSPPHPPGLAVRRDRSRLGVSQRSAPHGEPERAECFRLLGGDDRIVHEHRWCVEKVCGALSTGHRLDAD